MQPITYLRGAHCTRSGSRKFNCQGDTIEAAAYFTHGVAISTEFEVWLYEAGTLHEQLHGGRTNSIAELKWRHRASPLAIHHQRLSTGRQQADVRAF